MARWKRAASVEGDGPRKWLLERRQEQLRKIRGLLSAATTFEFSAFLAAHREREIAVLERTIRDLESGETVYVDRWEIPRSVELPGVANRYAIDAQDRISAAVPGDDEGRGE